eukprot:jgi/Hompol1/5888/HPOL_002602-RA
MAPPKKRAEEEVDESENELSELVIQKYTAAGNVANKALEAVIAASVAGATVLELCSVGDAKIASLAAEAAAAFAGSSGSRAITAGVAFPTCVSPGAAVCHLSPLPSDREAAISLAVGDVVRIQLGAHVDGYIATVAHSLVVGASKSSPVDGRKADVLHAAHSAAQAALHLIAVGETTTKVSDTISKITKQFDCKPVEGITTHQMLRNVLDGPKQIVLNVPEQQRRDVTEATFAEGDVYGIDIVVSTGQGKARPVDTRTTVYKRNPDSTYQLKLKTSRAVLTEVLKNHKTMAFSLRHLEDEKAARMGIVECAKYGLVSPYHVLYEKEDAFVAHFMYTVLLTPKGLVQIAGLPFDTSIATTDKKIVDEELAPLMDKLTVA